MMKQVLAAFMLAIAGIGLSAQDKVLSIYYISHSPATNEKALLSALNIAQPLDKSESAIFYLAWFAWFVIITLSLDGVL